MNPIPDCPGYFATEDGRILSFWRKINFHGSVVDMSIVARELRQFDRKRLDGSPSPYLSVSLVRGGKRCNRFVHDVVCLAFHGPRPTRDHEVRHKDSNSKNNSAGNLAWGTLEENTADRHANGAWDKAWARRRATMPAEPPNAHDGDSGDGHAFTDLIGDQ